VTGTVVGTVVLGVVGVVTGFVVAELDEPLVEGVVVGGVTFDVGEVLFVVEGVEVGVVTTGFVVPAKYTTRRADSTPELTRSPWVSRRTRANRRSRCCGVRVAGVIRFP
jgi:hypothetical protein